MKRLCLSFTNIPRGLNRPKEEDKEVIEPSNSYDIILNS